MGRVMAKTFDVESGEKGSPLQTKFNAFTKGKNIEGVHAFRLAPRDGGIRATLLYSLGEGEATADRLLAKVVENVPVGSELQTKINSFSKGKDLDVKAADVAANGDEATVAVIYSRADGETE